MPGPGLTYGVLMARTPRILPCGRLRSSVTGSASTWLPVFPASSPLASLMAAFAAFAAGYLARPLGNTGLWSALLIFLVARGLFQALLYRKLLTAAFPAAQSAAAIPVTPDKLR